MSYVEIEIITRFFFSYYHKYKMTYQTAPCDSLTKLFIFMVAGSSSFSNNNDQKILCACRISFKLTDKIALN